MRDLELKEKRGEIEMRKREKDLSFREEEYMRKVREITSRQSGVYEQKNSESQPEFLILIPIFILAIAYLL
jgi:hypothetical protein